MRKCDKVTFLSFKVTFLGFMKNEEFHRFSLYFEALEPRIGKLWAPSLALWCDLSRLESVFGEFVGGLGGPKGVSRGAREGA